MSKAEFSVLMCVNRDNPFLDESIKSVLNQSYDHFEFLIIANNCTDSLYEKLKSYNDKRIKLHRTSIGQLSFNLNYGVDLANGEYIVRMDADDICLSNRLELTKSKIESGYDVIAFSCDIIDENNKVISQKVYNNSSLEKMWYMNPITHPSTAIKKSAIIDVRGYLGGFQSEDYDLWIRLAKAGKTFHLSEDKVLNYRVSSFQSKGNLLPYCEVSSYYWRELMLNFKFKTLLALLVSVIKIMKQKIK